MKETEAEVGEYVLGVWLLVYAVAYVQGIYGGAAMDDLVRESWGSSGEDKRR